jgi:hypothetical protein
MDADKNEREHDISCPRSSASICGGLLVALAYAQASDTLDPAPFIDVLSRGEGHALSAVLSRLWLESGKGR